MTIRKRLERLERAVYSRPTARCSHCSDWGPIQTSEEAVTVADVLAGYKLEVRVCPQCGWSPLGLTEVIVDTHDDVAALARHREAEEMRRLGQTG